MIGIYKITNLLNGKCYVGQSIDIEKRWAEHKSIYNHPRCSNYHIYRAFRKYGIENFSFSVIEECEQALLNEREKFWIQHHNSFECGYNMTIGGDGTEMISRSDIHELWDDGLSVSDIATKIDCSPVTVSRVISCYDNMIRQSLCDAEKYGIGNLWRSTDWMVFIFVISIQSRQRQTSPEYQAMVYQLVATKSSRVLVGICGASILKMKSNDTKTLPTRIWAKECPYCNTPKRISLLANTKISQTLSAKQALGV